jgi:hypothetical protein
MSADRDHLNRKINTLTLCALYRKTLKLTCPKCHHARLLDAVTLWWMFERKGWDETLPAALRRFYCDACWRKKFFVQRAKWEITDLTPTGPQFAYPDERSWKRLIRRYRS